MQVGTPGYMAPQLLGSNVEYDGYKNDIWGLGCVLYEASALKPAFSAFNMAGLVKKVGPVSLLRARQAVCVGTRDRHLCACC